MNEVVIPLKIQGIAQMKAELRELKGSIASATDPAQMAALAQQAGVLSDRIKDANEAVAVFASGSKFEQVSNGLGGIKDSLMSLDFEEAAEKSKTFATALGGINKTDITKSMKGMVDMTKTLSGAFLKLGMTILMNPIFLIVAAVVAIIAVVALVLKSFGVLDDVINAMMMPINAMIAGFKALTDWLGLTAFAAEDNAARTLAANEKVSESSKERTASMIADLGREIAEAKAAGKDTTKLEEEKSNVQIKGADKRRDSAYKALAAQRKLGEDADQETIKKLKKQIREENEIIKQGYSDKTVAKLNDIKADATADATAAKEAAARAKQYASDRLNARREIRKQEIGLAGSDMEQEKLTIINDHKVKLEDIKNNAALTKAEKIRLQELENQLFEEKKIDFTAKQKAIDTANIATEAAAMAASHTANIAKIDAYNARLSELTDTEEQKLYDKYAADLITFEGNELALFNLKKKYEEDTTALKKTEADKQKAIDDAALQAKKSIISSEIDAAKGLVNLLGGLGEKNKKIQKAALIANAALSIAEIINNTNVGSAKEVATKGVLGLSTSAILYIKMATSIASVVAATAKGLSALGGGSVSAPSNTGGGGGGESTTAVAPAAGPQLFGNANTGSQINAGGGTGNNITVTAVVSETEITASQNHINNIQQNSVL